MTAKPRNINSGSEVATTDGHERVKDFLDQSRSSGCPPPIAGATALAITGQAQKIVSAFPTRTRLARGGRGAETPPRPAAELG